MHLTDRRTENASGWLPLLLPALHLKAWLTIITLYVGGMASAKTSTPNLCRCFCGGAAVILQSIFGHARLGSGSEQRGRGYDGYWHWGGGVTPRVRRSSSSSDAAVLNSVSNLSSSGTIGASTVLREQISAS